MFTDYKQDIIKLVYMLL